MANIDTGNIENFNSMTPEQKVEALLKLDIPEKIDLSGYVKKDLYDKTASDLSKTKKDLQGKMTTDEAAAAEQKAKWDEMESKIAALQSDNEKLRLERTESIYKAKYLAMPGFDEKLAEETAKAMATGNIDKVFENQAKANTEYEKKIRAELIKNDPKPGGSGGKEDDEPDNVTYARQRGKERAKAMNATNGILDKYKI